MLDTEATNRAALGGLLPGCGVVVTANAAADPGPLPAAEEIFVAGAASKRRREFALGRHCAREALARLGEPVAAILVGEDRAPVWPADVVGSLTHCQGFVAAAVAHRCDLAGLGIDAEPAEELTAELLELVCLPGELDRLLARRDGRPWGKVAFSAKESVYKCVAGRPRHPAMATAIRQPGDVAVDLRLDGTFSAASPRLDLSPIQGRWCLTATHVLTTATVR